MRPSSPSNDVLDDLQRQWDAGIPTASEYWREHHARMRSPFTPSGLQGFVAPYRLDRRLVAWREVHSYRALRQTLPHLRNYWGSARQAARKLGVLPDGGWWRSACILATLASEIQPRSTVIIGDGAGSLGVLLRRVWPASVLWLIDLPRPLLFQARAHQVMGERLSRSADGVADVRLLLADELNTLGEVELAINVASMQEMTAANRATYFSALRARHVWFYCVNRVEKMLTAADGVSRFHDYPWYQDDEVRLDGLCPYYTHWYDRGLLRRRRYNPIWHRLARLAPNGVERMEGC